jgi:hypothetical protein
MSNVGLLVNNELENIQKEVTVKYVKVLPQEFTAE